MLMLKFPKTLTNYITPYLLKCQFKFVISAMDFSAETELCQHHFNTMWEQNIHLDITNLENDTKKQSMDSTNYGYIDEKALRMMSKMGYQTGSGLGRNSQGILDPVELQNNLGRRGFGHTVNGLEPTRLQWDSSLETITIEERAEWIESSDNEKTGVHIQYGNNEISQWLKVSKRKLSISDETNFCDAALLSKVLKAKEVFDELDAMELCKARSRANPFETLKSAFFMNRAALKMANIDAATNFLFTSVDRQTEHKQSTSPYYFADICAGPGGFSEYVFWRKKWAFKGFGMTLRGEHDFKLHESTCAPCETFEALYGVRDDGNVYYPENIQDFCTKVKCHTHGQGVHFIMADGGFSVEGQENLQEVLSKQIYVCQCLIALNALRLNGHFVCKLFDLFTSFSVGLIYLMYRCFHKVAILKPNSSRPANSERYLICCKLKQNQETVFIKNYIENIVHTLFQMRSDPNQVDLDVNEIVPDYIIQSDKTFVNYIIESNNRLAKCQIVGLNKLASFCRDSTLFEPRQEELRTQCLAFWQIPDKPKTPLPHVTTDDLITSCVSDIYFMFSYAREVTNRHELSYILEEPDDFHFTFVASAKKCNLCNVYAGLGRNRVYRFQRNRWVKVKGVELVRGTVLFAELVREFTGDDDTSNRKSLHVIDALRLGETSLADLPYHERLDLISIYCQAVNKACHSDLAHVRLKSVLPLSDMTTTVLPTLSNNGEWILPVHDVTIKPNYYSVNSLLLFRTDINQSFGSTISSREIIHLPNFIDFHNNDNNERFGLWEKINKFARQNDTS